jgi:hypothetical protein
MTAETGSDAPELRRGCVAAQVPPPPGVRPWNWRRQQTRAVMRQQALAEAAEGKGNEKRMPANKAEALLLAAEQEESGSPVRELTSLSTISTTQIAKVFCCWGPAARS